MSTYYFRLSMPLPDVILQQYHTTENNVSAHSETIFTKTPHQAVVKLKTLLLLVINISTIISSVTAHHYYIYWTHIV